MNDFNETKKWLDYLYYEIGKQNFDFDLQILTQRGWASRRFKYSEVCFDCDDSRNINFIRQVNQRQIFPNEIILDIEDKKETFSITTKLLLFGIPYNIYDTGSRGVHIHIFLKNDVTEQDRLKIIKQLGADEMLNNSKHMIALENVAHWKSGKIKREII